MTVTERARESEMIKKKVQQNKERAEGIVREIAVDKAAAEEKLVMRIMDATIILFRSMLTPGETVPSPKPSWGDALKVMASTTFLRQLLDFPKDSINDETVELLEPYLTMEDYNMSTTKRVCRDVSGLLCSYSG